MFETVSNKISSQIQPLFLIRTGPYFSGTLVKLNHKYVYLLQFVFIGFGLLLASTFQPFVPSLGTRRFRRVSRIFEQIQERRDAVISVAFLLVSEFTD